MENNSKMNIKLPSASDIREKKHFMVKMDEVTDKGNYAIIKGWGAVKGNTDFGDDILMDGCFTKTEQERGGKVPFLQDHIPSIEHALGVVTFSEKQYGLWCEFEINLEKEKGREAYSLAKQMHNHGIPMGASIGFAIPKGKSEFVDMEGKNVRLIKEVILYEVSMTLYPMNDKARMVDVKSILDFYPKNSYVPVSLFEKVASSSAEHVSTSIEKADANNLDDVKDALSDLKSLLQKL